MIIWKTVPVKIRHKVWHIHKLKGIPHRDFCTDYGEIPTGRFNEETQKFEPCDNPRGLAYAARKRQKYRRNPKKENKNA